MSYSLLCYYHSYISLTYFLFFFFNDTATTEIYTLSLHDALPISSYNSNRPSYSNSGRSYEPPQRSQPSYNNNRGYSPQRSYNPPPSRSYSEPRTYSAPSRRYPAPSRSYSAPSYSAPSRGYSGGGGGSRSYSGGGGRR